MNEDVRDFMHETYHIRHCSLGSGNRKICADKIKLHFGTTYDDFLNTTLSDAPPAVLRDVLFSSGLSDAQALVLIERLVAFAELPTAVHDELWDAGNVYSRGDAVAEDYVRAVGFYERSFWLSRKPATALRISEVYSDKGGTGTRLPVEPSASHGWRRIVDGI